MLIGLVFTFLSLSLSGARGQEAPEAVVEPSDWFATRQALRQRAMENKEEIPWAIDLQPEWLSSAYFQEDNTDGPVVEQKARGIVPLPGAQPGEALRPSKQPDDGGVEFAENAGKHLIVKGHRDARWTYRWCVFIFRIDAKSGTGDDTVMVDVNQGRGSYQSSPKIRYSKTAGLSVSYTGQGAQGVDTRSMRSKNHVVADGKTWNVLVCGIRQGRLFAAVNGYNLVAEKEQPGRFSADLVYDTQTFLGDPRPNTMRWAYDALVLGQSELSEEMVRKMTGWAAHRRDFTEQLPPTHAYAFEAPVVDAEDFPHRYEHDNDTWLAWIAGLRKEATRVNAGGRPVAPEGFERVFYDDFRAKRIARSTSGQGDLWMAPGFNTAVGGSARLLYPDVKPDVYPYDRNRQQQTLSLADQGGKWYASAFYSINDLGQGYTWSGPKIFRIRCMFPEVPQGALAGGLFPAFWSYSPEFIYWRSANRIEIDWFEFDGKNGRWYNGLSSHYHAPQMKTAYARNKANYKRAKVYGGELTEEKSRIPGGFHFWDGRFHTWEFVVDRDMTYVNITYYDAEGQEQWAELCRCPTPATYLERLDLQIDYALKAKDGVPAAGARQDFVVDWVEVLQKTEEVEKIAPPFTARPSLRGKAVAGETLTCDPAIAGIEDLRYYWFADGYPLTYGAEKTYTLTAAESGKNIRCMVKAVGARDMPEAWSDAVAVQ